MGSAIETARRTLGDLSWNGGVSCPFGFSRVHDMPRVTTARKIREMLDSQSHPRSTAWDVAILLLKLREKQFRRARPAQEASSAGEGRREDGLLSALRKRQAIAQP